MEINTEAKKYRKLFVGGLSRDTNEATLKNYFEQWGKVVDCVVVRNPVTGLSKGFSFLVFKESASLNEVQIHRPHIVDNQYVETRRAMPYYKNPGELRNVKMVYTGRVRKDTCEVDVHKAFSKYGTIEKIEWIINNAGKYTGFLFLTFEDIDSVDKCVLQSRVLVNGSYVVVNRAVTKTEVSKEVPPTPPAKLLPSSYLRMGCLPYMIPQCYPGYYMNGGPTTRSGPVFCPSVPMYGNRNLETGPPSLSFSPSIKYMTPPLPHAFTPYDVGYDSNKTKSSTVPEYSVKEHYYHNANWINVATRPLHEEAYLRLHN